MDGHYRAAPTCVGVVETLICLVGLRLAEAMRRKRRGFFDEIFDRIEEMFEEVGAFKGGFSSSYSISVTYDDYGRPIVRVSAQGDVDRRGLEEYLRERYPNAKIIWEREAEGRPISGGGHVREHVREVTIREVEDSRQRPRGVEIREVEAKRPKIYEVKVEDERKEKRKWYDIKVE